MGRPSNPIKAISFAIGSCVGLLVLAVVGLFPFLDDKRLQAPFEAAAPDVMGMEVKGGGGLGIDAFPN
jgi:hypothetical protein